MKLSNSPISGLLLGLLFFFYASSAAALDDPALDYYTITTPHFHVHYYDGLEGLARRTAIAAEESHELLAPLLDWEPASRTHILVIDRLDTANGFARVFGRNFVTIYGMPPAADSVLGYFDDWLRVLVYHEYVHILHLDTNPGIAQWLNRIIGKQYHPNSTLPRWYIEGIAVYLESQRAGSGRVQSPLFHMWLRTAALEDELFSLGQSSGLPIQWPSGSAPYLYGAFFIDYLARHHGENFIRDFNHRYGRRIIPYALNHIARELTGSDFDEHWQSFIAETLESARAQEAEIEAVGRTPLHLLSDGGGRNRYPVVRPGSGLGITYHRADQTRHPVFASLHPSGAQSEAIFNAEGATGPSAWSPDGQTLYFSRTTISQNVYTYQDLFAYTPETGQLRQLTQTDRAREPDISPDGERIVYARNRAGSMELVLRSLDALDEEDILLGRNDFHPHDDAHWQQISRPVFTPDGEGIVFSWWRLDLRRRDLFYFDLSSRTVEALTESSSHEMDPHFGPDGYLYFTADVDGIFNIHAMDLESRQVWQVSNVVNGVFSPQVSNDGQWIYVHTYTHQGFEIARFAHPLRFYHPDRREDAPERPALEYINPTPEGLDSPRPYRAWPWLAPMFFIPDIGVVTGGAGFGGTLSGYDPVEHHEYSLSAGWTTGTDFDPTANVGLGYRYSGGAVTFRTLLRFQDYPRTNRLIAESRFVPFIERQYLGRLILSYPLRYLGHRFSFSTSFQVEYTGYRQRPEITHEPGDIRPQEPLLGFFNQLSFGASYGRLFRYPLSISTERGVSASGSLSLQHPALGSQENSVTFNYGFDAYHPNPLVDRHVFALQLRGAVTRSASGPQRRFAIGGHAPQDVLMSTIFQEPRRGFPLRGYPPGLLRGGQYQVWKLEYRFPIAEFDQGFSTVPLFFRNLKGSIFIDTGTAYDGHLADAQFVTGLGAEVQLDALLGYYSLSSLRLGYAYGLQEDGLSQWYLLFGGAF